MSKTSEVVAIHRTQAARYIREELQFPEEFSKLPHWVTYKLQQRDGKTTKVPYNPNDLERGAKSNDPTTWGTLEQAQHGYRLGHFDGVGFNFSHTIFTGIDLDWKKWKGEGIPPVVQKIMDFFGSYTEISPSGLGCHIIFIGKLPPNALNRVRLEEGIDMEVYSEGRYFTMTGDIIEYASIEDCQNQLDRMVKKYLMKPIPPTQPPRVMVPVITHDKSDAELLEKAQTAKNGAAFRQLWNGDTSAQDGDHSRADLALCKSLLFWFGPTSAEGMFRSSGLMRDKWDVVHSSDGRTYGQMTLGVALEGWDGKQYNPVAQDSAVVLSALEHGRAYGAARESLYLQGESVLRGAQGHHMSRSSYWLLWTALCSRMNTPESFGYKKGRFYLRVGGMMNFNKELGSKPSEVANRLRYLSSLGFIQACERLEPTNHTSELVIYLPEDPMTLGLWQFAPESSKSLILEPVSHKGRRATNPATIGLRPPPSVGATYSRVRGTPYPLRNAFRVAQALELHGIMDVKKIAGQACKTLPTVKRHLEILTDAGCVTEEDGVYIVNWAGYEQAARDEREFSDSYRRGIIRSLERTVGFYARVMGSLGQRTSALSQRRLTQCRKRYDFAVSRLERLSDGEPVWAVLS